LGILGGFVKVVRFSSILWWLGGVCSYSTFEVIFFVYRLDVHFFFCGFGILQYNFRILEKTFCNRLILPAPIILNWHPITYRKKLNYP